MIDFLLWNYLFSTELILMPFAANVDKHDNSKLLSNMIIYIYIYMSKRKMSKIAVDSYFRRGVGVH